MDLAGGWIIAGRRPDGASGYVDAVRPALERLAQLAVQDGVMPCPLPVPWKPNSVEPPAGRDPL